MAFEQYTRCEEPADWKPRSYWMITLQSLILAPFAVPLALAFGKPWCLLIVAEMTFLAWVIAYARNFLYHRLICLGGDRCVIGAVVSISTPVSFFEFDWDNDYSINLLLQNTAYGVTQAEAEMSSPYGELIAGQDVISNPPVSRDTPGKLSKDKHGTLKESAILHSEFEGAGNYNLMQVSQGMLGFAVAALLACVFLPYPLDVVLGAALALLALLGWLVGALISKGARQGDPTDVDPDLGTLQTNDSDGTNGLGSGADIVYVQGTWVYDPLHAGWNEIHPIKACTKVGKWEGDWSGIDSDLCDRVQRGFDVARDEETKGNQEQPEHQWEVHPDVDGCRTIIIE